MTYDAATGQVVLFGGAENASFFHDTWTWDGTDWTKQHPIHSPTPREYAGMTYDAAAGQVVLFGGSTAIGEFVADTWTWDGTEWSQQQPTHSPSARDEAGMSYDGHGQVVLFGGHGPDLNGGDTWTWDGLDWTQHLGGSISLSPPSGPPGASGHVVGWGFAPSEHVKLYFLDSVHGRTVLATVKTDNGGAFMTDVFIPNDATPGDQHLRASGGTSGQVAKVRFYVT
jgi:hypothetical protein